MKNSNILIKLLAIISTSSSYINKLQKKGRIKYTFSAIIRSPLSRVGDMEADGIDLGSAKDDLNIMLTLKAVKAAFASSEQMFNNFDTQRLLETFISLDKGSDRTELSLHLVSVPPLSTSELPEDPILGSLQGSHFEP